MNKLIILLGTIVLVFSVSLAQAENINGIEIDEPMLAVEAMMSQDVGADFTIIRPVSVRLSPARGTIYPYWYQWNPDFATFRAKAIINIRHSGNPFRKIVHQWVYPGAYGGGTAEPFAIADWSFTPSNGYLTIRVVTDRQAFTSSRITIFR